MSSERVLLIVTPSVTDIELDRAVPSGDLRGTTLKVVVPAVADSALAYWFSDDKAISRARDTAGHLAETVGKDAASVQSTTGDCDPALAAQDALATFDADRIIVVHREDHPGYREEKLDHLEETLHREVEDHLVPA